jgi:glycosyltransferase involved in cell wall biosynthesis
MNLHEITPLLLTRNEEPNLPRVIARLGWAREIVVIDSHSDDRTLEILRADDRIRIVQHPFESFASQWNFGLTQTTTPWVLALDADFVLTDEFAPEVRGLDESDVNGYFASFRYCIEGKPLRATLYPPRMVLFRKDRAAFEVDGHAQTVRLDGSTRTLRSMILHDDRKPLRTWLQAQDRYAELEVHKLRNTSAAELSYKDRLRRSTWIVPLLVPFYCLFVRGLVLDGSAGLFYTFQRTYAELLLALKLADSRLARPSDNEHSRNQRLSR